MKKTGNRCGTLLWVSVIGVSAVITTTVIVFLSWAGRNSNPAALLPMSTKTQLVSTAGGMNTPTSTRSWLATSTMAAPQQAMAAKQLATVPQQTGTPTPSQIPILSYIFIPVIEKAGNPLSFQARLPLLIKTNSPVIEVPFKEKTILVDISDQHVYAYEKGKLIYSFVASTGRHNLTRIGHYKILDKIPNAYSDPWGFWMPYWMGIYYAGYNLENGFHSLPVLSNGVKLWGNKIGSPITYGCVVLMPDDMKKLYRWAGIGTAIVIQK
jgi:lipoprotein-anchoring transpeptidase ErfK/SrfK